MAVVSEGARPLLTRSPRDRRRKLVNGLMESLASFASLLAVAVLVLVVGSVLVKGISAINIDFLTHNPVPFGQKGGGIAPRGPAAWYPPRYSTLAIPDMATIPPYSASRKNANFRPEYSV